MRKSAAIGIVDLALLATLALAAAPAQAQTTTGYSDLPETFRLDGGGFRIAADTKLQYSLGGQPPTEVDFEEDTALPSNANTFWLDGTWRVGRRHQLSVNVTRSKRESEGRTLTRDITWGDQVFTVGRHVQSEDSATILTGYYRFAVLRNDRFEIGPTVGVGYLWMDATLRATPLEGEGGGDGVTASIGHDHRGRRRVLQCLAAPARGAARRPVVRLRQAGERRRRPSPTAGSGSTGIPGGRVGFGAQYKYYKYRYERGLLSTELGGSLKLQGGQAYVSFLF